MTDIGMVFYAPSEAFIGRRRIIGGKKIRDSEPFTLDSERFAAKALSGCTGCDEDSYDAIFRVLMGNCDLTNYLRKSNE